MTSRSRAFAFTLNNYNDSEYMSILAQTQKHSKYYIIGKEVGESGTPHLQGYVYFENAKTFNQMRDWLDNKRVHFEIAKGNKDQNYKYCSKEGDFISNYSRKGKLSEEEVLKKMDIKTPQPLTNWEKKLDKQFRHEYELHEEKFGWTLDDCPACDQ